MPGTGLKEKADGIAAAVTAAAARARAAQSAWAATPLPARLAVFSAARPGLVAAADALAASLATPRRGRADAQAAEVIPLADAMRFLEREAEALLAPTRLGRRGRPRWLFATDAEIRREPLGLILVIGPGNYPLFLPGVQIVQALAAGNAVLVKPSPGKTEPLERLRTVLRQAGLPEDLCILLDDDVAAAEAALEADIDKVVLTGSAATGRAVLDRLAARLVPTVMELSGNDPVIVLPGADLDLAVQAVAYGLRLNGSATCIAPRRVFLPRSLLEDFAARLSAALTDLSPVPLPPAVAGQAARLLAQARDRGARILGALPDRPAAGMHPLIVVDPDPDLDLLREDIFAPLVSLIPLAGPKDETGDESGDETGFAARAAARAAASPYALGASIFGPEAEARRVARSIQAGSVVINDIIVPTADPRLPFGGRRRSGFGATRGAEGILEMTALKTVSLRRGRFRPHFDAPRADDEALFRSYLEAAHGATLGARAKAVSRLLGLLRRRG